MLAGDAGISAFGCRIQLGQYVMSLVQVQEQVELLRKQLATMRAALHDKQQALASTRR